jgi:hypothetical protein
MKVLVSRSRPLTCSPPPFGFTAAAVATLPSVNFIFTTPKFVFPKRLSSRRMAHDVFRQSSPVFKDKFADVH